MRDCPICKSEGQFYSTGKSIPDFSYSKTLEVLECPSCGARGVNPVLDPENIYEDLYRRENESTSAYARYFETAGTKLNPRNKKRKNDVSKEPETSLRLLRELGRKEPAYFAVYKALAQLDLKPNASILEIGSGLGYLTRALNTAGFSAHGIDISSTAVSQAREFFGSNNYSCISIEEVSDGESFDLIVATEVIEHVLEPLDLMKKSLNLLRPGGSLIITTPNRSFFPADMVWESSLPPVHHWWFTERSLELAARKLNVEISFIDFTKFFNLRNALVWDTENLDSNYQGAQKSAEKEPPPNNRLSEWGRGVLSSSPWIIYTFSWVLENIPQKRFLVADQKCHTVGAVIRKPHS